MSIVTLTLMIANNNVHNDAKLQKQQQKTSQKIATINAKIRRFDEYK